MDASAVANLPIGDQVSEYLAVAKASGADPNFFMSWDYLTLKQLECRVDGGRWGFGEPGEPGWYLPPVCGRRLECIGGTWAGLPDVVGRELLDCEYLYDPKQFLDLSGSRWKVYRKNVRKWPSRGPGVVTYRGLAAGELAPETANLVAQWADGRELYDPETMIRVALDGRHRWGLFRSGELVGLNVCDVNWRYVNFRLCVDNGDPFLQEYLRHQFYTSRRVQCWGRLVNDGGSLGSEGLRRFKEKLNPLVTRAIYSH